MECYQVPNTEPAELLTGRELIFSQTNQAEEGKKKRI